MAAFSSKARRSRDWSASLGSGLFPGAVFLIPAGGESGLCGDSRGGVEVACEETAVLCRQCWRLWWKRSADGRELGDSAVSVVDAAESVEEGTVSVVDRSLLTTSDAVTVLEFSEGRGVSALDSWVVSL